MTVEINEALARKVLQVVDAGLVHGMGKPEPGKMCVEAAVNYAMGAPHGDEPACVSPALRRLKIRLNDARWTTDAARTKGLRRLAIAQLGSAGHLDEKEFVRRVAKLAMRGKVPKALRAVAALFRDGTAAKERLLNAAAYWKARENGSARRDAALAEFCEGVVQILIEMKAPGCQWLELTEEAA